MAALEQSTFVEDSARSEAVAQRFFYALGDVFAGVDSSYRYQTAQGVPDVAKTPEGAIYVRGTTQPVGGVGEPGFVVTPTLILMGLGLWYLTRKKA